MRKKKYTKVVLVFLMLVALVILTACGKESDNDSKNDGGSTKTENTQSTNDENVKDDKNQNVTTEQPQSGKNDSGGLLHRDDNSGNNGDSSGGSTANGISDLFDDPSKQLKSLDQLMQYYETGTGYVPHELSDAEKKALKEDVERQGGKIEFGSDGSLTITGEGESRLVLYEDGRIEVTSEDGDDITYTQGNEWPKDSALGKVIPDPGYKIKNCYATNDSISMIFEEGGIEEAQAFGTLLKNAGFTVELHEDVMPEYGMYSFDAQNADGIMVTVTYIKDGGFVFSADDGSGYDGGDYGDYGDYDYGDYDYGDYDYGDYDYGDLNGYGIGTTTEWPSTGLLTMLPEPDFGTGYTIEELPEYAYVVVQGAGRSDFTPYVNKLKQAGFNKNVDTDAYEDVMFFEATNDDGYVVFVQSVNGSFEFGIGIPD